MHPSSNGRKADFQSDNAGSIPVGCTNYMKPTLPLSIVTIESPVFSGDVYQVDLNTTGGGRGILPLHEPTSMLMRDGLATVHDDTGSWTVDITGGFADMTSKGLSIMAFKAIRNV